MVVKIADPMLMREINKYHVLETIRCNGRISRVEISEETELSGTTVSAITGALIEEGLVEASHADLSGETQRGRPRVLLSLVGDAAYVLGIKISERATTVTLVDFRGEVVTSSELPIRLARQSDDVIVDLIEDALTQCIGKSGVDRARIKGIGIGIPGIVDPRSGRSHASAIFGERDIPIGTLLSLRMGMPVRLEKPVNLLALAESWFGYAQKDSSFAVVLLDQSASLGIWLEDDLHRGASNLGPAFGHLKVGFAGQICDCGQADCLNTYIGQGALRRQASAAGIGGDHGTSAELQALIAEAVEAGNNAAAAILADHAQRLGLALSHIVNLVNPRKVILATESSEYGEALIALLRDNLQQLAFPAHLASTELILHRLDDQLWARGAAALMLRDIYSAPWTTSY